MILVSACVVGEKCRYDGNHRRNEKVLEFLKDKEYRLICPEMMGGLSCPRNPSEQIGDRVVDNEGKDVTENFQRGAGKALELAQKYQPELIILEDRSPSCGTHVVYDGTFSGKLIAGQGVTARLLSEHGFRILSSDDFQ